MIVSQLELFNFRKFKSEDGKPGLSVTFHKGLNALIGENDSGKTAVIDSLKLVLLTQSNEYIRPTEEDFYIDENGKRADEFRIDCIIAEMTEDEAKNFIEYLTFEKGDNKLKYSLKLHYRAWIEKNRVFSELRVGEREDGIQMDSRARELLRSVYLKPLRDAEHEMRSGKNSRISQILMSHSLFNDKENHRVKQILEQANIDIEKYFTEEEGKIILSKMQSNLDSFNDVTSKNDISFRTSDIRLKSILESLSLDSKEINPGLGELNMIFIAAELLLLSEEENGGLKLALIEELEAHLHPQAQLRLIQYLQKEYNESGVQIIVSTHSTVLASKINLKNIVLMKNNKGYDLSEGNTALEKGDYLFLQRFLDSTKANLFFAKGIIMVEGDAENLLIPLLAEIIGYPLEKYGVSVVNVGSTAFLRYSRILARSNGENMGIPVSIITDCDVKPYDKKKDEDNTEKKFYKSKVDESDEAVTKKKKDYSIGTDIKAFVSPRWTLEYCLAASKLRTALLLSILFAKKIKNSDKYALTQKKIDEAKEELNTIKQELELYTDIEERAYHIYRLMLNENEKSGLKAIVAQCLSSLIRWKISIKSEGMKAEQMFDSDLYQMRVDTEKKDKLKKVLLEDPYLKYLIEAIIHAVGCDK